MPVCVGFRTKTGTARDQQMKKKPSKASPERLIFEKTGVEIQGAKCCGHLDMTPSGNQLTDKVIWDHRIIKEGVD
jgi:hypothetical protein